jgi:hypothetical protein
VSLMRYQVADRPVFAIIGWATQGGDTHGRVRVLASRTLSAAELEVRRERYDNVWVSGLSDPARVYTQDLSSVITVEARDFVMIEAATWREIMEALYRRWGGTVSG